MPRDKLFQDHAGFLRTEAIRGVGVVDIDGVDHFGGNVQDAAGGRQFCGVCLA